MKKLSTSPIYRTYYVNNSIIYDIKYGTKSTSDEHAIIYNENSSFPNLRYEDKYGNTHIYYLDSLIEDGDKLTNKAFVKVCHSIQGEPEKTPFEYFKYLCERQIASVIASTALSNGYSYYYNSNEGVNRLGLLGVPNYMLKQNYNDLVSSNRMDTSNGAVITALKANDLIDFSEQKYNQLLNEEILRRAKEATNNAVRKYNKKVNTLTLIDI